MKCLPLGQMSHLESLRALCQGLYFLLYLSAIFPKLFILAKQLLFMQNTVNVLESPTLLVILLLQELDYLRQCILAFPYSESVEGWVLRMAFLLSLQTHATLVSSCLKEQGNHQNEIWSCNRKRHFLFSVLIIPEFSFIVLFIMHKHTLISTILYYVC